MTDHIRNRVSLATALAAGGLLLAACGGGSGSTAGVSAGAGASSSAAGAGAYGGPAAMTTAVHTGPLGKYVTDASGRTLYVFSADHSSMSACHGACAKEWPPVMSGGTQLVYKGHPLYYFAGDKSPGQMNGEGLDDFGGTWTAVHPDGSPATAPAGSSSPSSSGSSGGGSEGWG